MTGDSFIGRVRAMRDETAREIVLMEGELRGLDRVLDLIAQTGSETQAAIPPGTTRRLALPAPAKARAAKTKRKGRRKDPDRDAKVLQLSKAGTAVKEIARQCGLSDAGVRGILKRLGAASKPARGVRAAKDKAPPALAREVVKAAGAGQDERIAALSKLGKWDADIAKEMGIPVAAVRAALVRSGARPAAAGA